MKTAHLLRLNYLGNKGYLNYVYIEDNAISLYNHKK